MLEMSRNLAFLTQDKAFPLSRNCLAGITDSLSVFNQLVTSIYLVFIKSTFLLIFLFNTTFLTNKNGSIVNKKYKLKHFGCNNIIDVQYQYIKVDLISSLEVHHIH